MPVIDDHGRTPAPPAVAYQHILHGVQAVEYTTRDILFRPRNARVHRAYGMSPVEQILMTVNIALRRQLFTLQYFTEGNIPESLIGVPEPRVPKGNPGGGRWAGENESAIASASSPLSITTSSASGPNHGVRYAALETPPGGIKNDANIDDSASPFAGVGARLKRHNDRRRPLPERLSRNSPASERPASSTSNVLLWLRGSAPARRESSVQMTVGWASDPAIGPA